MVAPGTGSTQNNAGAEGRWVISFSARSSRVGGFLHHPALSLQRVGAAVEMQQYGWYPFNQGGPGHPQRACAMAVQPVDITGLLVWLRETLVFGNKLRVSFK